MSINKVILVGYVGNDPEIRQSQNGTKITSFSLATSESWKDKNSGERIEKTEWHKIIVLAQGVIGIVEQFVKKGSRLYVEGSLQTRKWKDNKDIERYITEVVLKGYDSNLQILDKREGGEKLETSFTPGKRSEHDRKKSDGYAPSNDRDDEIPF